MKKILLGSTALLGAGLLSASAAAQVELQISGYAQFEAGWVDEDNDAAAERDYDFRQDGWIQFNARGVADNGLEYGAEIELDDIAADEGIEQDEQYVYVRGGFGTLRFGDKEGAVKELAVTAPTGFGSGGFDGNYGEYMIGTASTAYLLDAEEAMGDTDATKITYLTPEFSGFQAGISFTPTDNNKGKSGKQRTDEFLDRNDDDVIDADDEPLTRPNGEYENVVGIAANYAADFEGFNVLVGAGYLFGSAVEDGEDLRAFDVGLNVGFGGFTVGAQYVLVTEAVGIDEVETIQFGATYEFDAWTFGANAALTTEEDLAGDKVDTNIYSVGATYSVAPGLAVYADSAFIDSDTGDATVFLVGTSVAF